MLATTNAPAIEVYQLTKKYYAGGQQVKAINNLTFRVEQGEVISIIGPSGSGKSTLLGLLGGLDNPTSGSVKIAGTEITGMAEKDLSRVRNMQIGFVFQFFNLIDTLTAAENVALPIQFSTARQFEPHKRAVSLLSMFDLEDRLNHRPSQLSGGQQQRVAIARALANNPPLLLADEPTGNLNSEAGRIAIQALRSATEQFGTTVVIVTHDQAVAEQTDRTLRLVDGQLVN